MMFAQNQARLSGHERKRAFSQQRQLRPIGSMKPGALRRKAEAAVKGVSSVGEEKLLLNVQRIAASCYKLNR